MFLNTASFELRYQLRSPVFWVTVVLFGLLSFAALAIDQIHVGGDNSNVHRNAPYVLANLHLTMGVLFMFASTAIVANVIVRDDETGFGPILRSSRISKVDYLYGRFAGAFAAICLAFMAVPVGSCLGALSPWLDRETLGPVRLWDYVYDDLAFGLPTVFLTSALFFAVAATMRSMMGAYLAMVGLLVIWTASTVLTDKPELEHVMAYAEPFGLGAFSYMTKYWTVAERNTLNLPLSGPYLWSRLIWTLVGLAALASAHPLYRFASPVGRRTKPEKGEANLRRPPSTSAVQPAAPRGHAGGLQFMVRTRFEMMQVFGSPAFFVLLALASFNAGGGLWLTTGLYGTDVYPVTRLMIATLQGAFTFIPVIVAVYYAGELVWRERDRKTEEFIDSTPTPDWAFAAPKILAIALVLIAMLLCGGILAIAIQALKGWTDFQLDHYLAWYVAPTAVQLVQIAILAVFVQTLAPHKFIGFAMMLVYIVVNQVMRSLHLEDYLYRFAGAPPVPLSDMNGEGRFGGIRAWFELYWSSFALILMALTYGLWRRGRTMSPLTRFTALPRRLAGPAGVLLAAGALAMAGTGAFIFYNTHILNPYRTAEADDVWTADLEKTLLRYEAAPQPKITDVQMQVDLYPADNRAVTHGVYVLENRTGQPLKEAHVRFARDLKVVSLSIEGARPKQTFERFNYRIFAFDAPMAPGERRRLSFQTERSQQGFRNSGNDWTRIHANGTFLDDHDIAPGLGIDREDMLKDRAKRRKYGLPPQLRPPKLEDPAGRQYSLIGKDADWVRADITVSTTASQTPMAPGYKVSDRVVGDRRIAEFRTEAPILKFFSIQSAAYAQTSVPWKGVQIGVYYHPGHQWNVDRMIRALKVGLDYDQANFSPYQFRQVRVLEFPAYADFAQSFANTIPYSENLGWIEDARNPDKIDMVTYVTAHELAHQWWAHQVIGGRMQGATMLDETLAQYSALMEMEKLYGPAQIRRFLKFELDRYLRARGGDQVEELPLERVEDQGYIHYRKGSLVMYRLKEELGEDRVNAALRIFLQRYAFRGAPFPTSRELVDLFRAEARPDQQDLITDLFQKITLYDVKARAARVVRRPDGRWDLTLTYEARKLYADGQGREAEAPMHDTVDIGAFTGDPQKDAFSARDVVEVRRMPVESGVHTVTLTLDRAPTMAGIDPYHKLIDRNADDNDVAVKR